MLTGKRLIAVLLTIAALALAGGFSWHGWFTSSALGPDPQPGVVTESFSVKSGGDAETIAGFHPADVLSIGPAVAIPCPNLGLICTDLAGAVDDIDGLSYGQEFTNAADIPPLEFSVGTGGGQGIAGTAVRAETAGACAPGEAAADAFETDLTGANLQDLDGDGVPCSTNAGFLVGLCEVGCAVADNIDALEQDPCGVAGVDPDCNGAPDSPVYFTLTPSSPSLADPAIDASDPGLDATAADILQTSGGGVIVYADGATQLGLMEAGDVIDAFCLRDDGDGVYTAADQLLFSLAPGSPSLGALPASAADLLRAGPGVMYAASRLGLQAIDDLDALKCPADDSDGDSAFNIADNCVTVANPDQANHDTDTMGDACDDDDDDDGFKDADETLKGSDPLVKTRTPEHCNGVDEDGDTVVDEAPNGSGRATPDPLCDSALDIDGDTIPNSTDTDDDGDGFTDTQEVFASTDPLDKCSNGSLPTAHDAWPLDNDRNRSANVADVLKYKGKIPSSGMTTPKSPLYDRRLDIDGNGLLNVIDVLKYKGKIPSSCT